MSHHPFDLPKSQGDSTRGAESRRPLGLAVVGGLLVSQLLTLYITPVYYVYIENARLRMMGHKPAAAVAQPDHGLVPETAGK